MRWSIKSRKGRRSARCTASAAKGIPHLRGKGRGDQYVKFVVEVPRNLSERQKELLREFDQLDSGNNKERGKFFDMLNRFKK